MLCTVYTEIVLCMVYTVHSVVYGVHSVVYGVHSIVYGVHSVVYGVHTGADTGIHSGGCEIL